MNYDGSAVVVDVCSGKTERTLVCNSDQPNCKVISAGQHDLDYLPDSDNRAIHPGQNMIIDD